MQFKVTFNHERLWTYAFASILLSVVTVSYFSGFFTLRDWEQYTLLGTLMFTIYMTWHESRKASPSISFDGTDLTLTNLGTGIEDERSSVNREIDALFKTDSTVYKISKSAIDKLYVASFPFFISETFLNKDGAVFKNPLMEAMFYNLERSSPLGASKRTDIFILYITLTNGDHLACFPRPFNKNSLKRLAHKLISVGIPTEKNL